MSRADDPFFQEEDLNNPSYYCAHGTFIGNPFGGDYLCGYCEDGTSPEEYEAIQAEAVREHRVEVIKQFWLAWMVTLNHVCGPEGTAWDELRYPTSAEWDEVEKLGVIA